MHRVFVYGTLKKGFPNYYLIDDASNGVQKFVGNAVTVKSFPLVVAGRFFTPYVLDAPGKGEPVHGEVFEVDDKMLATLDKLESHPHYYQRDYVQVKMLTLGDLDISSQNIQEKCGIYFLRNYKEELLDLPKYAIYVGEVTKGYIRPKDRDPNERYKAPFDVLKQYDENFKFENINK